MEKNEEKVQREPKMRSWTKVWLEVNFLCAATNEGGRIKSDWWIICSYIYLKGIMKEPNA